jgi:amino acid transporter
MAFEESRVDTEKGVHIVHNPKADLATRRESVASMMAADLQDMRYEKTKRGLKSRHAQMIALGGTIGTG